MSLHKLFIGMAKKRSFILALVCCAGGFNAKAQGTDIVILIDFSYSTRYDNPNYPSNLQYRYAWPYMESTAKTLIDEVLGCDPNNRVTVVGYGSFYNTFAGTPDNYVHRLFIHSDFTSDAVLAKNFSWRSDIGGVDFVQTSLGMVGDALDGVVNSAVTSTQKTLNHDPTKKLAVVIITESERASPGLDSYLINRVATEDPFKSYNQFKLSRKASLVVIKGMNLYSTPSSDSLDTHAAAAMASVGGGYTGAVEVNPNDPEGSGTIPRKLHVNPYFQFNPTQIQAMRSDICSACEPVIISFAARANQTVCQGAAVTPLSVSATGPGTLSYQWFSSTTNTNVGGIPISGATQASYTPPNTLVGTRYYYVVITSIGCQGFTTSVPMGVTVSNTAPCTPCAPNAGILIRN